MAQDTDAANAVAVDALARFGAARPPAYIRDKPGWFALTHNSCIAGAEERCLDEDLGWTLEQLTALGVWQGTDPQFKLLQAAGVSMLSATEVCCS